MKNESIALSLHGRLRAADTLPDVSQIITEIQQTSGAPILMSSFPVWYQLDFPDRRMFDLYLDEVLHLIPGNDSLMRIEHH